MAEAELEPGKQLWKKIMLHNIVSLNVRVYAFSFAYSNMSSSGTKLNQSRQTPSLSKRKLVEVAKRLRTKGMNIRLR